MFRIAKDIHTRKPRTTDTAPTRAMLSLRIKPKSHFDWRMSWQSRTTARAAAKGQLRIATEPRVENIRSVLLLEGGCKENACASVTPYIAKLDGR